MVKVVKFVLIVVLSISINGSSAQTGKPGAAKPVTFKKFTPPKLTSILGIRSDTATVYTEEAIQLVKLPLKVTDDKKGIYTITSYSFKYTKRVVTEDEGEDKVTITPTTSVVMDRFNATPLPAIWSNTISDELKPGEELYFFDIIAKDAQGRIMFAPTLKIKVR